jgi:predicted nucleic acid-binding protein
MKSFKNLFIKDDSEEREPPITNSFPVSESSKPENQSSSPSNPYLQEIAEVYEKGLESINMPGYDFYDFFLAIKAAGSHSEAIYKMAFQMGKTLDSNITTQKLSADADYYISKLKEVYQNYSDKGKQKLKSLAAELKADRDGLTSEIHHIDSEIARLKQQISSMEQKLAEARNQLTKVEEKYRPQQDVINLKLQANDQAMQISTKQLTSVKEGVLKYIK